MSDARIPKRARRADHATVLVVVEGGRTDSVHADTMPFLHGMSRRGVTAQLHGPAGFAPDTAMFTGQYPDRSGRFSPYVYDPDGSPFAWLANLGPLASCSRPARTGAPSRWIVKKVTQWINGAGSVDPAAIPPRFLPYLRPSRSPVGVDGRREMEAPSVFELCREQGLRCWYPRRPDRSGRDDEVLVDLARQLRENAPYDLFMVRLRDGDRQGRRRGPHTDAMSTGRLRVVDEGLASVHAALSTSFGSWDFLVCCEPGMAPADRSVDPGRLLRALDVRPGDDYVAFVYGDLLVLWYQTRMARDILERALSGAEGIRMVGDDERRTRRIPMGRAWGDRLFAARPGFVFEPDYLGPKARAWAAHGSIDESGEGAALAVLASSNPDVRARSLGPRPTVDVFPTLCGLLGLRVPPDQEGTSLVGVRRDPPLMNHPRTIALRERLEKRLTHA